MQAAVEFLLMAKQPQQAFEVAQMHGHMDAYVRFMGSNASSDDCVRIAMYYEARGSFDKAAQLYSQSGQPHKALLLYMQVVRFPLLSFLGLCLPFAHRFVVMALYSLKGSIANRHLHALTSMMQPSTLNLLVFALATTLL